MMIEENLRRRRLKEKRARKEIRKKGKERKKERRKESVSGREERKTKRGDTEKMRRKESWTDRSRKQRELLNIPALIVIGMRGETKQICGNMRSMTETGAGEEETNTGIEREKGLLLATMVLETT